MTATCEPTATPTETATATETATVEAPPTVEATETETAEGASAVWWVHVPLVVLLEGEAGC